LMGLKFGCMRPVVMDIALSHNIFSSYNTVQAAKIYVVWAASRIPWVAPLGWLS